jgi:hypothetical protein
LMACHQDGSIAQRILYNPSQPVTLAPAQEHGLPPTAQQAFGKEGSKDAHGQSVEEAVEKGKEEQPDILDQLMLDGALQEPQPGGMDMVSADQQAGESVCSHVPVSRCIPCPALAPPGKAGLARLCCA